MNARVHAGGCLCGGVRYEVTAEALDDVAHCHCTMCRRASGAPLVAWFTVPPEAFRLTLGALRTWRSSAAGERGFCPDCGCQISFRDDGFPDELDVTAATLDDPEQARPSRHIWTENTLSWLQIDDHLPRMRRDTGSAS